MNFRLNARIKVSRSISVRPIVDPRFSQLLGKPSLNGPECSLRTSTSLGGIGIDGTNPKISQDSFKLGQPLLGRFSGLRSANKVTPAIHVKLAKETVGFHNMVKSPQAAPRVFLRNEPAVQRFPIGIIKQVNQVPLPLIGAQPVMRASVQVQHHARHGPAFPSPSMFASGRGFLGQTGRLQKLFDVRVAHPNPVPLRQHLVEMPKVEIEVPLSAKPENLPNRLMRNLLRHESTRSVISKAFRPTPKTPSS